MRCSSVLFLFFLKIITVKELVCEPLEQQETVRYEVTHEFIEVLRESADVKFLEARIHKYNRSLAVLSLRINITSPSVNNYTVWIDGYERYGVDHTYQKGAITHAMPFCTFITNKVLFSVQDKPDSNLPSKCPVNVGVYYMRNHIFEQNRGLPKELPGTFWRLDIRGAIETQKMSNFFYIQYYAKIDRIKISSEKSTARFTDRTHTQSPDRKHIL